MLEGQIGSRMYLCGGKKRRYISPYRATFQMQEGDFSQIILSASLLR